MWILFNLSKLSYKLKKKHINKITLKHQTSRLSYQLKLSNINNSNKLKMFYINKIKIIK
jgi:hypothetical protein